MARPVVIVHGYSDKGATARNWCACLKKAGYEPHEIHVADYLTISNEVTIKDIAEAFDRAVRLKPSLNDGEPFDAMFTRKGANGSR